MVREIHVPKDIAEEWEAQLRKLAEQKGETIYTPAEEDAHFGEAHLRTDLWDDQIDEQLAQELASQTPETGTQQFMGSPENKRALEKLLKTILQNISNNGSVVKIKIHTSCITNCDCIIIGENLGVQHHINTRHIDKYTDQDIYRFAEKMNIPCTRV